jgi:hypothetical protein
MHYAVQRTYQCAKSKSDMMSALARSSYNGCQCPTVMTDHFIVCMGTIPGSWQICHMHPSYINVVLKVSWRNAYIQGQFNARQELWYQNAYLAMFVRNGIYSVYWTEMRRCTEEMDIHFFWNMALCQLSSCY